MKIYSDESALGLPLAALIEMLADLGAKRVIYKILAPNDNSKNQPYMAASFSEVGFIPTGELVPSPTNSTKQKVDSRSVKFTSSLEWFWVSASAQIFPAPSTKLIYYPQYPEVRLSGFSKGCDADLDGWMDPNRNGRSEGRVLIIGIADKRVFGFLALPHSFIAQEINEWPSMSISKVFREISLDFGRFDNQLDNKMLLLSELKRIHLLGFVGSKKLNSNGEYLPYLARNGGGYTLEAELGIVPNGNPIPDFYGWEVKQFGVKRFDKIGNPSLTLMTPEPDGGLYKENGALYFVTRYGSQSLELMNRYDFTGIHKCGVKHKKTGLTLCLQGYDPVSETMTDASGAVCLVDSQGDVAASWSFAKLIDHWKNKHTKAVYIPSVSKVDWQGNCFYQYGSRVRLYEGANIINFLAKLNCGVIYYDPGLKVENVNLDPKVKRRNQIRIKSKDLKSVYGHCEEVDLLTI